MDSTKKREPEDLIPQESTPGAYTYISPTFSSLITVSFCLEGSCYLAYLYSLIDCPDFGVLLPKQLLPIPDRDVKFIGIVKLNSVELQRLVSFQFEMWSDLLRLPKDHSGVIPQPCYLVTPITPDEIDWSAINTALGLLPRKKITDVDPHSLPGSIWQATYVNKATWILVDAFLCCKVTIRQFLTCLMGRRFPDLDALCDKYVKHSVSDLILEENFDIESLKGFRALISRNIASVCDFYHPFVFVKPTKSIIQDGESTATESQNFPKGTPLLHSDILDQFYLTRSQWEMARKLPETLIRLENHSRVIEFAEMYGEANFYDLREALTTTQLDVRCNFENLENLGDTVLKFLVTLMVFTRHPEMNESSMTDYRTHYICNANLKVLSKNNHLYRYMRTNLIKPSKWRPPFYDGKMGATDCETTNYLNEKAMADIVEALIGAYYLHKGTVGAVNFLQKLNLLKNGSHWDACAGYLSDTSLVFISQSDLDAFQTGKDATIGELLPHSECVFPCGDKQQESGEGEGNRITNEVALQECEQSLGYVFQNKSYLLEALTQRSLNASSNYERLEFLGDSVIDIVVVSNTFPFLRTNTSPRELTNIKHILVNNQTLSRLTIASELYRYCHFCSELKSQVDQYLARITWTDNLLQFGIYQDEPPKQLNDVLEGLIGAVLVDSKSLKTAATVTMRMLRPLIMYLVKFHESVQKNIVNRLIEVGQRHKMKLRVVCEDGEQPFAVVISGEDDLEASEFGETVEIARAKVIQKVIDRLEKESI